MDENEGMGNGSLTRALVFAVVLTGGLAQGSEHEWGYRGAEGPSHWGGLKAEYAACGTGAEQSPIDIRKASAEKLPKIQFDYKETPLKIIDNGHSVQVNYAPGSFMTVAGKRYELRQMHFHHPAEERIGGRKFAMVAHLVHADSDGKLAVVAVLLDKGAGNGTIQEIWGHIPSEKGAEQEVSGVRVNAAGLLPKETGYYTFAGSLTTPPCTEGVTWFVLKTPSTISVEQEKAFGKLYPLNARPVQKVGARRVRGSE